MYTGIDFSYKEEGFDHSMVGRFIERFVKFEPKAFGKKYKTVEWNPKKHNKKIAGYNDGERLMVSDGRSNLFSTGLAGLHHKYRVLSLNQDEQFFMPSDNDIEEFITDTMMSAFLHNEDYTMVQSTTFENNLKGLDIQPEILESIKQTPFKIGMFNYKEFNTDFNPGRQDMLHYTWMIPAWKMWFGKPFFELIPKEKILSFPHAEEIRELPNGALFVQLYDDIHTPYTTENKFRQWKWREWLNYDHLIVH